MTLPIILLLGGVGLLIGGYFLLVCATEFYEIAKGLSSKDKLTPEERKNLRSPLKSYYLYSFLFGLGYAGVSRLIFKVDPPGSSNLWSIVTASFLFLVPLAFGSITVCIGTKDPDWDWKKSLYVPCLVTMTGLCGSIILGWEALFCVLMVSPVMMVMSMLGGIVTYWIIRRNRRNGRLLVSFFIFLPYLIGPLENRAVMPNEEVTARTQIEINASPSQVWSHIASVSAISASEIPWNPVYLIGFPRPIQATLSHTGVGGVRHATFERNVIFTETVTKWTENHELTFDIHANGDFVPPATFDRGLTRGGQFFEVLSGTYWIESLSSNRVVLHLLSHHRLSTRFNWYTGLWTNWIMNQIQDTILQVIKARCEDKEVKNVEVSILRSSVVQDSRRF